MSTQISISPVIKLEVNTTPITGGSAGQILFQTTGNTVGESSNLFWDATNNRLGIGTSSPSFGLDVNGTSRLQGRITTTYNSSTTTGIVGAIGSGTDLFSLTHANEGYLLWLTSGFTTPNDYANGYGIGIGNPNSSNIKLIAGNITSTATAIRFLTNSVFMGSVGSGNTSFFRASPFTGFQYDSQGGWNFGIREAASSTYRIAITGSTGNVLINTTTDAGFRLDVNGTARVSGQLTATADAVINGVNIGIGAGSQVTNTRVGRFALNFNTTGIRNTSVGQEALYATTTGSNNSAFGRGAIAVNTTGGNNSALGQNALFNNTTGNNNTVIGNNSLFAHTTGDSNSVLGADTVSGNFSGSVILGRAATATADNQFVVGSSGTNAGSVTTETNTSTQVWNVVINGVARKILLA